MSNETHIYCVDEAALRDVLSDMLAECGTQTALAAELKISTPYLGDILQGRRPISALASRLGYKPLTVFVREDGQPGVTPELAAKLIERMRQARIAKTGGEA